MHSGQAASVSRLFVDQLLETVGHGQGGINKPLNTVDQAGLRLAVQFVGWFVHAPVPAHISEHVNLVLKEGNGYYQIKQHVHVQ